jgi:hypothetical protein
MGVLINFPSQHCQSPLNDRLKEQDSENKANLQEDPSISNFEDKKQEQAFANILREWPCYSSFGNKLSLENILDMYYDDELSVQQDYVLEYLFHMHDPKSSFDIANALYSWGEHDRNFFILSLNLHSEIIDQIKKQEY